MFAPTSPDKKIPSEEGCNRYTPPTSAEYASRAKLPSPESFALPRSPPNRAVSDMLGAVFCSYRTNTAYDMPTPLPLPPVLDSAPTGTSTAASKPSTRGSTSA